MWNFVNSNTMSGCMTFPLCLSDLPDMTVEKQRSEHISRRSHLCGLSVSTTKGLENTAAGPMLSHHNRSIFPA